MTVRELTNLLLGLPPQDKVRAVSDGIVIGHRCWIRLEHETHAHVEELEEV